MDPRIAGFFDADNHSLTFGRVYANRIARTNIFYNKPAFPQGSIIVREKLPQVDSPPEIVMAMVKRETGFSADSGDWEFFVFGSRDLALQSRETVGTCASCHVRAKDTDWTFRTYMNFLR